MSARLPFLKFFPSDWLADQSLRMCGAAARGAWMDMLCVMWKAERKGYLETSQGVPVSIEQLARIIGESPDEVTRIVSELESAGVFSREDGSGVIFSRRIVKDVAFLTACSEAGRKGGGNPSLQTFKGCPKGASKGQPKPQKSDVQKSDVQISNPAPLRARDAVLDALAAVGGGDISQLTKTAWGAAARAKKEISDVSPNLTPDEVARRAANYRLHFKDAALTAPALTKHWARCDKPPSEGTLPERYAHGF